MVIKHADVKILIEANSALDAEARGTRLPGAQPLQSASFVLSAEMKRARETTYLGRDSVQCFERLSRKQRTSGNEDHAG